MWYKSTGQHLTFTIPFPPSIVYSFIFHSIPLFHSLPSIPLFPSFHSFHYSIPFHSIISFFLPPLFPPSSFFLFHSTISFLHHLHSILPLGFRPPLLPSSRTFYLTVPPLVTHFFLFSTSRDTPPLNLHFSFLRYPSGTPASDRYFSASSLSNFRGHLPHQTSIYSFLLLPLRGFCLLNTPFPSFLRYQLRDTCLADRCSLTSSLSLRGHLPHQTAVFPHFFFNIPNFGDICLPQTAVLLISSFFSTSGTLPRRPPYHFPAVPLRDTLWDPLFSSFFAIPNWDLLTSQTSIFISSLYHFGTLASSISGGYRIVVFLIVIFSVYK